MFAHWIAPLHIGQGSPVVYISHPDKSYVFNFLQAFLIAIISPWQVQSLFLRTILWPFEIIFPSLTMTAPKGPPSPFSIPL